MIERGNESAVRFVWLLAMNRSRRLGGRLFRMDPLSGASRHWAAAKPKGGVSTSLEHSGEMYEEPFRCPVKFKRRTRTRWYSPS